MINDDEDEVRFKTLEILIELIEIFKVSDYETLPIILFNLKENSQLLRKYLYKLISKVYVNKTSEFELVLDVSINIKKIYIKIYIKSLSNFYLKATEK